MEEASFQGRAGVEAAANFVRQTWREANGRSVTHSQSLDSALRQVLVLEELRDLTTARDTGRASL
jgi:hypothetical protein